MTSKIYCANCRNCVIIPKAAVISDQHVLRLHCTKDKWKKKVGEIKYYKYFTASRRTVDICDSFESMGDSEKAYIKDLKKILPVKDEVYSK